MQFLCVCGCCIHMCLCAHVCVCVCRLDSNICHLPLLLPTFLRHGPLMTSNSLFWLGWLASKALGPFDSVHPSQGWSIDLSDWGCWMYELRSTGWGSKHITDRNHLTSFLRGNFHNASVLLEAVITCWHLLYHWQSHVATDETERFFFFQKCTNRKPKPKESCVWKSAS